MSSIKELPKDDLAWLQLVRPTLTSLVKNQSINDRDVVIYFILRAVADFETGEIDLTRSKIAQIFGMDIQKIGRAIESLISSGYIKAKKYRGKPNTYMIMDTATLSNREVKWSYIPQKFGKISEELKKMKKTGELPNSPFIQIGELNLNVQININNSSSPVITPDELAIMNDLAQKGLLPKLVLEQLSTYQK